MVEAQSVRAQKKRWLRVWPTGLVGLHLKIVLVGGLFTSTRNWLVGRDSPSRVSKGSDVTASEYRKDMADIGA